MANGLTNLEVAADDAGQRRREFEEILTRLQDNPIGSLAFAGVLGKVHDDSDVGIGIGGAVTYYNYARHFRAEAAANLTAIAALKAAELAQWREERLSDIAPYQNPLFAAAARSFLEKPKDPDARRALALWFQNYPGRGLYAGPRASG